MQKSTSFMDDNCTYYLTSFCTTTNSSNDLFPDLKGIFNLHTVTQTSTYLVFGLIRSTAVFRIDDSQLLRVGGCL